MTQVEFERGLSELRAQANAELQAIESWQVDIKQKIAASHEMRAQIDNEIWRMNAQRKGYSARRMEIERKWKSRIAQFKAENYNEERVLAEVSDYVLAKELARRGWYGPIHNDREDMATTHKEGVAAAFNWEHDHKDEVKTH